MSEEDNMALNVNEEEVADTTPVSEATEEVEAESIESTEEVEETETETGEEQSSKGYSNRVRQLNSKAKQAEERAARAEEEVKSLSDRIAELTGGSPAYNPYTPQVQPGAEISPDDYRTDVMRTAESIVNLRFQQQQAATRIQSGTDKAVAAHPELNPESDNFDPDLSQSVTAAVEAYVKADPYQADVKGFVDQLMKPYKRSVTKEVGKVSENLARQVSQTATKPTSVRSSEKPAEEKSIEQLEKELGVVY